MAKYTNEFREQAVRLVEEEGYKIKEAAESLGISSALLTKWKQRYGRDAKLQSSENSSGISEKEELRRLRKEVKRLQMERDLLKKAAAFFAKESL